MKFTEWKGQSLVGEWLFTYKIDGIQLKRVVPQFQLEIPGQEAKFTSKGGNPLYNLPKIKKKFEFAEIFTGNYNQTWSIVSASKSKRRKIREREIYPLYPSIDSRLVICTIKNPTAELINIIFNQAVAYEYEGLVLRQGDRFIKVKTIYTEDIKISGFVEGKGKFKGMLGKFTTKSGDVGTGFTVDQRILYWGIRETLVGRFIEVEAMSKSANGILRNPRFLRLRLDK